MSMTPLRRSLLCMCTFHFDPSKSWYGEVGHQKSTSCNAQFLGNKQQRDLALTAITEALSQKITLVMREILSDRDVVTNVHAVSEPVLIEAMTQAFGEGMVAAAKDEATCAKMADLVLPAQAAEKFEQVFVRGLASEGAREGLKQMILQEMELNDPEACVTRLHAHMRESVQLWRAAAGEREQPGGAPGPREMQLLSGETVPFDFERAISELFVGVFVSEAVQQRLVGGMVGATQEGVRMGIANSEHEKLKEELFEFLQDDTFATAGLRGSMAEIKRAVQELMQDEEVKLRFHSLLMDTLKDEGVHSAIFKGLGDAMKPRFPGT